MKMLRAICRNAGLRPGRLLCSLRGWRRYRRERKAFLNMPGESSIPWGKELPILREWDDASGGIGAYFQQDLTVARWILGENPARHVDVGSRIDGFIGHLAVFRNVEVLDIRPPPGEIPGVVFHQLDLMDDLPVQWRECTDSLSCLHTIEHFGLGRYGDPLNPDGHLKGLEQLKRMVMPGGHLYLSTPIGPERIEFNAHRIFTVTTLLGWFDDGWQIEKFAWIDEANRLHEHVDLNAANRKEMPAGISGVGIVVARKASTISDPPSAISKSCFSTPGNS